VVTGLLLSMHTLPLSLAQSSPTLVGRRWLLWLLAAGGALLLAACAGVTGGPRLITVSEAQVVQRITEQFPLRRRYLELFDLTLSSPRVRLMPAENRVGTRVDYALGDFWGGSRRYDGTLTLSYGLRLEPTDNSVRMTDVRVEAFDAPNPGGRMATQVQRLGALVAEHLLNDFTLHRFKPEDLQSVQQRGYRPGSVRVVDGGLQLELLPISN
jgi:hypothetical protein